MRRAPRPAPWWFTPGLFATCLAACEPTAPMSHPFQQAPVAAPAAMAAGAEGKAPSDPRFAAFDETFSLSSEEMGESAVGEASDAAAPPEGPAPGQPAVPSPTLATVPDLSGIPLVAQVPSAPLGWAIRLVTTLPEAQPPRAVLGLPDGREIVVTPGSMVPDAGLVVLSVGTQGVQLARVQAMGDHATVDAMTLTPQY